MIAAPQLAALQFGDANGLLGLATLPPETNPTRPAILFLNAGLIHRVGPFGMYVDMARRLAASGFLTVRIDQSGLGDSLPAAGTMSSEERTVRDAEQAMDAISEHYGVEQFVLVGLCAGAMSVHRAALADPRVAAACLLDGYAYKMPRSQRLFRMQQAADPRFWRRMAHKAAGRLGRRWRGEPEPPARSPVTPRWPPREVIAHELNTLLARGSSLLFIYTGGWSSYVHRDQFDEMFPDLVQRQQIEVEFYPEADHTYLILAHRERMIGRLERFLTKLA